MIRDHLKTNHFEHKFCFYIPIVWTCIHKSPSMWHEKQRGKMQSLQFKLLYPHILIPVWPLFLLVSQKLCDWIVKWYRVRKYVSPLIIFIVSRNHILYHDIVITSSYIISPLILPFHGNNIHYLISGRAALSFALQDPTAEISSNFVSSYPYKYYVCPKGDILPSQGVEIQNWLLWLGVKELSHPQIYQTQIKWNIKNWPSSLSERNIARHCGTRIALAISLIFFDSNFG